MAEKTLIDFPLGGEVRRHKGSCPGTYRVVAYGSQFERVVSGETSRHVTARCDVCGREVSFLVPEGNPKQDRAWRAFVERGAAAGREEGDRVLGDADGEAAE